MGIEWEFIDNYAHIQNGRIWMGWKAANISVTMIESSAQLMHYLVQYKNSSFSSYITFVYGLHTVQKWSVSLGSPKKYTCQYKWFMADSRRF